MGCGGGETEGEVGELPGTYLYSMAWSDSDEETVYLDVWVKEEKSRIDISQTLPGEETGTIILIDNGEFEWMYYPDENQAYKWLRDDETSSFADAYTWWFAENYYSTVSEVTMLAEMQAACAVDPTCASVAITGHEAVGGQSCTKFTYTAYDGATTIYWVSSSGWLMKLESTDATGYSLTMGYSDIDLNPSISNDKFDIDKVAPGAEIIDMAE